MAVKCLCIDFILGFLCDYPSTRSVLLLISAVTVSINSISSHASLQVYGVILPSLCLTYDVLIFFTKGMVVDHLQSTYYVASDLFLRM